MKILKYIGAAILVAIFILYAITSSTFTVERSLEINASPEKIYTNLSRLQNWGEWDPWHQMDPNMINTYSGPESGKGNKNCWESDDKNVGKGCQEIIAVEENKSITTQLDFDGHGGGIGGFKLEEIPNGTKVSWSMTMETGYNPVMRMMSLFMDSIVGQNFETGLNNLKTLIENQVDEPMMSEPADSLTTENVEL